MKFESKSAAYPYLYEAKDDSGKCLGRTPLGWLQLTVFYIIFYSCLSAFWGTALWLFYKTVDPVVPNYVLDDSLIGTNPGMGFRPAPPKDNSDTAMVWYQINDEDSQQYWIDDLDKFLSPYLRNDSVPTVNCPSERPTPGRPCEFDVESLRMGPCKSEFGYGYPDGKPCVFMKLNKIFDWKPQVYSNATRPKDPKMPKELQTLALRTNPQDALIWMSCEGESPADRENIGKIDYYPKGQQGFPTYYYPYKNAKNYLQPLVAVHFREPTRNVLINVECRAWAKNIKVDRIERMGSVHFELLIDEEIY